MRCIVPFDGFETSVIRNADRVRCHVKGNRERPILRRAWFFGLCLVVFSACGGPWRDEYLAKGVKRLTQDDVIEKLGPPSTAKTPVLGGDTVWTYRVPMGDREVHPWDPSSLTAGKKNESSPLAVSLREKPGRVGGTLPRAALLLPLHPLVRRGQAAQGLETRGMRSAHQ